MKSLKSTAFALASVVTGVIALGATATSVTVAASGTHSVTVFSATADDSGWGK